MSKEVFAQARPRALRVETLFTAQEPTFVDSVVSTNLTTGSSRFSIYVARPGERYTNNSIYICRETLSSFEFDGYLYYLVLNQGMRLGVATRDPGSVNFSMFGYEPIGSQDQPFFNHTRPLDEEVHTIYTTTVPTHVSRLVATNLTAQERYYTVHVARESQRYSVSTMLVRKGSLTAYDTDSGMAWMRLPAGMKIGVKTYDPGQVNFTINGWRA